MKIIYQLPLLLISLALPLTLVAAPDIQDITLDIFERSDARPDHEMEKIELPEQVREAVKEQIEHEREGKDDNDRREEKSDKNEIEDHKDDAEEHNGELEEHKEEFEETKEDSESHKEDTEDHKDDIREDKEDREDK